MPQTQVRVVGSGFTTFNYRGKPIAFLDSFRDSGQTALGGQGGYEAITPLGAKHPVEIATSRVLNAGMLTATIRELWNAPVWYQLSGLSGRKNIVDVWEALARDPQRATCQMIIKPPTGPTRGKTYHGCVVTAIDDGEEVTVGALSIARNIQIAYTHST
jgi:hypothetical protein